MDEPTGEGCGKTTVIRRVIEHIPDRRLVGFFTRETRAHGQRIGFEGCKLWRPAGLERIPVS